MGTQDHQMNTKVEGDGDGFCPLIEDSYPSPATEAETIVTKYKAEETANSEKVCRIPIATLVFPDGRTESVYKPLAGHEHLFTADCPFQAAPSKLAETPKQAPTQAPMTPRNLKRTRSDAQGLAANGKAATDDTNAEDVEPVVEEVTEESHTFYVGDIDAFKKFLTRRFDELTMKPLRGIATHWVKLIEPRRLGDWGKYHEMKPSEAETPPWWPRDVIYKEPSHLKKDDLSTLAVEMMLVHRKIDNIKRKGPWISKLRDVAKFTVQTTSADHFSSSKGAAHSEEMKKRALEKILPSIFEVAQAYEDHIMQYNLIEGSGNKDPGRGRHHTWKPIPRPIRQQQPKRPRRTAGSECVQETVHEVSGDETEPDDTMTCLARVPHGLPQALSSLLPVDAHAVAKVSTPTASGLCPPATIQDDCVMHRTASTPNSSFDQSLHGLVWEKDSDMKPPYNMPSYTQPLQYPSAATSSNGQAYQRVESYGNQASGLSQDAPTLVHPFPMFNTPAPPMSYNPYASPIPTAYGFPYE